MAALHKLWVGLVLVGVLGVQQTPVEAQVSLQPNFQLDKFLGRWFTAGLASNSSWFREKKAAMAMCTSVVARAPGEDGALNLTTTLLRKGQCERHTQLLRPLDAPGSYNYTSLHWGTTMSVRVVETDYDAYALLYTTGNQSQDFHLATLYSRTPTPAAELRNKFITFAKARGFTEDSIAFLPKLDKCLEEHQ